MNRAALESIFSAGLRRVDPVRMVTDSLSVDGETLSVTAGSQTRSFDLSRFDRIVVVGAGKASASMALGVEQVLGNRIETGLVSVKYGHTASLASIELIEAGHPVPDEQGVTAASRIAALADAADERTFVIVLISGGGSALLTLPYQDDRHSLSLADIQQTTSLLLDSGAPIQEINTIRKHLSGISGGRFCARLAPATSISLILSDVVGDSVENIASGLTSPDPATFADAIAITRRYSISERLPASVNALLHAGAHGSVMDTPAPGDPSFERVHNMLIGTNLLALQACREQAQRSGYHTLVVSSQVTGEAREVAKVLAGVARDAVRSPVPGPKPLCVLFGGETTVTIRGSGSGGRNQELALAFLGEIAGAPPSAFYGVSFLSAATDGNDGPTDAAGAFASHEILERSSRNNRSIAETLNRNDSYSFFSQIDGLLKTGPTNTNVCDIQILLVE
jgi:glycerate 2-kinase